MVCADSSFLVYSVARTLCPEEASDIFQQVCVELYERLAELRDEAALPKWLITVTRRKCYAVLRANRTDGVFEVESVEARDQINRIEEQHSIALCVALNFPTSVRS